MRQWNVNWLKVTCVNVNQECLELCHPLTSDKKKNHSHILRKKRCWNYLTKKIKNKNFNPQSIDIGSKKVFINEILCHYYKFLWSKCKKLWTEEHIEAFWVISSQIKLRIEPDGTVSRISHIYDLQKLLPDYNFQSD